MARKLRAEDLAKVGAGAHAAAEAVLNMGKSAKELELEFIKRRPRVVAFEQRCTSPRGVRQIVHRTDVIGDTFSAFSKAKNVSSEFERKYLKQGWRVEVREILAR